MVTGELIAARRVDIGRAPDLQALAQRLAGNVAPLLERPLYFPAAKALLSQDGGVCPTDRERLAFDPWQPDEHRCPRCGQAQRGERHHRAWVTWYQLWLAERAVHLALLHVLGVLPAGAARAAAILTGYGERYRTYPNRDNVLGPGRVFFSTYLESIWLVNLLTAGTILREAELLPAEAERALSGVAEESVGFIGEFNERFSNRQVWHDVALLAAADWFQDEDLGLRALEDQSGLRPLIHYGLARDGMWYEGENYHFFALRALVHAVGWARRVDYDLLDPARGGDRLRAAFRTPLLTALPDLTFPARKDSQFGVSLVQPRFAELWEIGYALTEDPDLAAFLHTLYSAELPPRSDDGRAHVSDVERNAPPAKLGRTDLSWMALLLMRPELAPADAAWASGSVLLEAHGLALLRGPDRYASVECGSVSGGHDHPDRLHLTLHAVGVPWLLDFGTGSYVQQDLFWYRSTRAHNAPVVDGASQRLAAAQCLAFDDQGEWGWTRCRLEADTAFPGVSLTRTLVAGPHYLLDVLEARAERDIVLELPWHFLGEASLKSNGDWEAGELDDPFVRDVRRFAAADGGAVRLEVRSDGGRPWLDVWLVGLELLRATAPGPPGRGPLPLYLVRAWGREPRLVALLAPGQGEEPVTGVAVADDEIVVRLRGGDERHARTDFGWRVRTGAGEVALGGLRDARRDLEAIADLDFLRRSERASARAPAVRRPPALDGTLDGVECGEPLPLDTEDQYRRAEEGYPGPAAFCATAYANWDGDALYVAVDVTKSDVVLRPADAPPKRLDNEPDDIHSDGLQLYFDLSAADAEDRVFGFLVVPDVAGRGVRVRPVAGTAAGPDMVAGAWRRTQRGYCVTLGVALPGWREEAHEGARLGFDLIINEMRPGRERRAGQLVWSGGDGWVWLAGDRQSPAHFGELELCP